MSKEAQNLWMETEGKRQVEVHNQSVKRFNEYIKRTSEEKIEKK